MNFQIYDLMRCRVYDFMTFQSSDFISFQISDFSIFKLWSHEFSKSWFHEFSNSWFREFSNFPINRFPCTHARRQAQACTNEHARTRVRACACALVRAGACMRARARARAVCRKGRDVISTSWWLALTRNSSLKINNCNDLSPSRCVLKRLPSHFRQDRKLVERISVARVQPRTSKGITDLLLPQTSLR